MKRSFTLLLGLLVTAVVTAASPLQLRSVTDGTFAGQSLGAVTPLPDGSSYAQLSADSRRIVQYSMLNGRPVGTLFDADAVSLKLPQIHGYKVSPDGQSLLLQTQTKSIYRRSFTASYYVYSSQNQTLTPLSDAGPQQSPLFSPDGTHVAFVRQNNIYIADLSVGTERQVTTDGLFNNVINGIPDWVNEEEFGISCSMVFTADGSHLVWVRYDEHEVPQYSMPLFKGLKPELAQYADYPGAYIYKYPIAGQVNSVVTLWSYDLGTGERRKLDLPLDADGYIPRLYASDDPSRIVAATLNRRQDRLQLYAVNPVSGNCQLLIEEQADCYIREEVFDGIRVTARHILLPSDRDGWMHLYLYDRAGRLQRQLDRGDYEVSQVYGYDESTGSVFFASHADGATDQRIWQVSSKGRPTCLTPRAGWNTAVFSTGYRYFINTWSNLDTPPVSTLHDSRGTQLATLVDNQALKSLFRSHRLGRRQLFSFTTADSVTLNGWMILPADFDPSRRYPVVMYQYGGPGSQQVRNAWNIGMAGQGAILEHLLCQQGYICVCIDGRGTGGRGARFEKCTYMQLGRLEAVDQVEGALWLSRQSYVDPSRIAIWGWSFGGFNTLMSMSEGRPVFRCGIAIAPPTSWRYYDTIYTERYMRTPAENPGGYADCPLARASRFSGALLLCHGMADDNVHFRNTAEFTEALVQADKDFRQLVYTNRNHSIRGGNTRHHLFRQCFNFFQQNL